MGFHPLRMSFDQPFRTQHMVDVVGDDGFIVTKSIDDGTCCDGVEMENFNLALNLKAGVNLEKVG